MRNIFFPHYLSGEPLSRHISTTPTFSTNTPQKQDIQHKTLLPISKYNIIILRYKTDTLTFSKLHTIKKTSVFLVV